MYFPYSLVKILHEERQRELLGQSSLYSQIDHDENSRIKVAVTERIRAFIVNLNLPAVFAKRYSEPVRTTQPEFGLTECQAAPECIPC